MNTKKVIIGAVCLCAAGFAVYHFAAGKKGPEDALKYDMKGIDYVKEGKYDKAISSYNDAIDLKQDPTLYYNRGVAFMNKGDNENAIKDFSKAIGMQPANFPAFNNRAISYRNSGKYDEAIADYSNVIKLKPDFSAAWFGRGICYRTKGDDKNALADLRKAESLGYADAKKIIEEIGKKK